MSDRPRETDVQQNRLRQLQEPYPYASQAVDQIVASKGGSKQMPPADPYDVSSDVGIHTGVPSNYEASLGGEKKSMSSFEVKKSPGRL